MHTYFDSSLEHSVAPILSEEQIQQLISSIVPSEDGKIPDPNIILDCVYEIMAGYTALMLVLQGQLRIILNEDTGEISFVDPASFDKG